MKHFTISNRLNGEMLYPIGSVCVNHCGVEDLNRDVTLLGDLLTLRAAFQQAKRVPLTSEFFTRALIEDLYEQGAFPPDQYNHGDPEEDFQFLTEMFNKRNKDALSNKQQWRIVRLLEDKVRPFVLADSRLT